MLISIIIPAYNAEKTIERCLESVRLQKDIEKIKEVLIVDDGSTDSTNEIVERFVKKDSRFRLIKKKNGGVSSARNEGIRQATGEYIIFCDSDDEIKSELCEELLSAIQKQKCDMAICGYTEIHSCDSISRIPKKSICESAKNIQYNFDELFYGFFLNVPWGRIFRAENIKCLFDESMQNGEDIKFVLDYLSEHPIVVGVEKALYVVHTENENSLSRFRMNALRSISKIQINLGNFVKENKIEADWGRLSDYCISLTWSNVVDGVNLGQFRCIEACSVIEIDDAYLELLESLKPTKRINKITKRILLRKSKILMLLMFKLLCVIKSMRRG
nr:glycosyltransferase family 2 protein [uncultured Mediterraneibacter sp.]